MRHAGLSAASRSQVVTNLTQAKPLRTRLEAAVKAERDVAEKAAKTALAQLATGDAKAPDYVSAHQKALRWRLCAHGRARAAVPERRKNALDRLIAAHAVCVEATLVTNNEADFKGYPGLVVENWALAA